MAVIPVLTEHAIEQSTYPISGLLRDGSGNAITPNDDITWSLSDDEGNIINARQNVPYGTPSNPVLIVLEGDDLVMQGREKTELRHLVVRCTYDSDLGAGKPFVGPVDFYIDGVYTVE